MLYTQYLPFKLVAYREVSASSFCSQFAKGVGNHVPYLSLVIWFYDLRMEVNVSHVIYQGWRFVSSSLIVN